MLVLAFLAATVALLGASLWVGVDTGPTSAPSPTALAERSTPRSTVLTLTPTPTATPLATAPLTPPPAPTPYVTALPTIVEAYYPVGAFEEIVCSFDWPCSEAVHVAGCESGRDTDGYLDGNWAVNTNHFGLFQLALPLHEGLLDGEWSDPYANAEAAHELWADTGDWRHWASVCRP